MKKVIKFPKLKTALCIIAAVFSIAANTALAADAPEPVAKTLIPNARIFDGTSDELTESMSVLVEGNKIAQIARSAYDYMLYAK